MSTTVNVRVNADTKKANKNVGEFNEKLNYIIDFTLSISKKASSNIHPVRLSDFIEELSNFRENLFKINSLNQRYALNHFLLKIPN